MVRPVPTVPQFDIGIVAEKLSGQIINMLTPDVLSSTAIKLNWEVRKNQRYIEGFHVKYRVAQELDETSAGSAGSGSQSRHQHQVDFAVETVQLSSATMYVLSGLQKYTWYEVRVQPFYLTVEGTESNMVRARTFEDGEMTFLLSYSDWIFEKNIVDNVKLQMNASLKFNLS